jgi:hypothetical protein
MDAKRSGAVMLKHRMHKSSQLFIQDIQGALRKNASRERKALMDGRRISHETVERNKRGNSRKHREQPIKNHPGCHGQQPIIVHLLIHAPKSGAPVGSEENPGRTGVRRSGCGMSCRKWMCWLEQTARRVIRRAAEVAHDPTAAAASQITMGDLPKLQ